MARLEGEGRGHRLPSQWAKGQAGDLLGERRALAARAPATLQHRRRDGTDRGAQSQEGKFRGSPGGTQPSWPGTPPQPRPTSRPGGGTLRALEPPFTSRESPGLQYRLGVRMRQQSVPVMEPRLGHLPRGSALCKLSPLPFYSHFTGEETKLRSQQTSSGS